VSQSCDTEIADNALICYRCGTATAEPRIPPPVERAGPRALAVMASRSSRSSPRRWRCRSCRRLAPPVRSILGSASLKPRRGASACWQTLRLWRTERRDGAADHRDRQAAVTIGRRTESDLRLSAATSRAITPRSSDGWRLHPLRDRGSRYGTLVNDEQVTEHRLVHGDRIQFGRTGAVEVVFLVERGARRASGTPASAVGDLRQLAALLEGLRALGSGRVLDEVLALVLDAAIEITGAERGFIMLASRPACSR
jgi:hypothetical protein